METLETEFCIVYKGAVTSGVFWVTLLKELAAGFELLVEDSIIIGSEEEEANTWRD